MEGDMTPITADLVQGIAEVGTMGVEREQERGGSFDEDGMNPPASAAQAIAERELKAILESLLFVSPEPLSTARLVAVLGDVPRGEIERALRSLEQELEQEGRGVRLTQVAGGYRLVTKLEYAPWVKRLDKEKSAAKLSRSALETLAIVAYKQPLVRSEIEDIRGVETSGVLRTLLERKLVRIVGRKEVPGRPIMYGTTKFFLEHFGLNDLAQLPPLREFRELGGSEHSLLTVDDTEAGTMVGESGGAGLGEAIDEGREGGFSGPEGGALVDLNEELEVVRDLDGEPVEQR
jgi:segregation and condensation protein B